MDYEEARGKHTQEIILGFFFYRCKAYMQIKWLNGKTNKQVKLNIWEMNILIHEKKIWETKESIFILSISEGDVALTCYQITNAEYLIFKVIMRRGIL